MPDRRRHLLWTSLLGLWLAGCAPADVPAPGSAERWVSLSPAITETLGALEALDPLVGRSDWCLEPASAQSLPAVGTALTPNLEGIAALRPSRILVEHAAQVETSALEQLAPTEALRWLTLEEVLDSTRRLGAWTGQEDQALDLTAALHRQLQTEAPPPPAPRVLLVLAAQGLHQGEVWYLKRNSLHGAALHGAGARNAIDRDVEGHPVLSVEQLITVDPDVIVLLRADEPNPTDEARLLKDWARLTPLRAVRDERLHVLSHPGLLSVGPGVLSFSDRLESVLSRELP